MSISDGDFSVLLKIVEGLYQHVLTSNFPPFAPYRAFSIDSQEFALDEEGYSKWYRDLLVALVNLPKIGDVWSEDTLNQMMGGLLSELANERARASTSLNLEPLVRVWLQQIDADFEDSECFVPVVGLTTAKPLTIGEITFEPLNAAIRALPRGIGSQAFGNLSDERDCLAHAKVKAEARRAIEILRVKTGQTLHILRYFGALVWSNQPTRQVYVGGYERKRTSYSLCIDTKGGFHEIGDSTETPIPFSIDDNFLDLANHFGLSHIQSMVGSPSATPLETSLLTAIQWVGDAIQEIDPLAAFMKYYTCIEVATKRKDENAHSTLPKRLAVLVDPWHFDRQREWRKEIRILIEERSNVFHGGKPQTKSDAYLAWASRALALRVLNGLRQRMQAENLETKMDLANWANSWNSKFYGQQQS